MNVLVATDTLKPSSSDSSQVMEVVISPKEVHGQESAVPNTGNSTKLDAVISVVKDITSFKKFQKMVEKKLFDLEKTIISQQTNPNNHIYNIGDSDENTNFDFF